MRLNSSRFVLVLATTIALGALAAGCGDSGPAGTYASLTWTIRCETMGMCSSYPNRDVDGFHGENGVRIACNVTETETTRTLTFSAYASNYGIQMQNAQFSRGGGTPAGTDCRISVLEDTNNFVGACGGSPPTEVQPCQVNNVQFTTDEEGRSLIRGNIFCVGLSPSAAPNIDRELTAPGTGLAAPTTPMQFDLYDCAGYNPG
ncbi:MAG: hypothetical protein M3Y87_00945 [Myxococcota bacterium]|nr:hypothetical protein [Myxococcota bacterium]